MSEEIDEVEWKPYGKVTIQFEPHEDVRDFFHGDGIDSARIDLEGKYRDGRSQHEHLFAHYGLDVKGRRQWRFPIFGEEGEEWVRGLSTEALEALDNCIGNLANVIDSVKNGQYLDGFLKGGRSIGAERLEAGEEINWIEEGDDELDFLDD